jgi:hypothetical protein
MSTYQHTNKNKNKKNKQEVHHEIQQDKMRLITDNRLFYSDSYI